MPLIKTRQAIMMVEPGATICVLATDPTSRRDFEMFSEATGHKLLRQDKDYGRTRRARFFYTWSRRRPLKASSE